MNLPEAFPAILFCLLAAALPTLGLELREYQPERHDRYVDYPENLRANSGFHLSGLDLSGVGFSELTALRHVTLVSPKHFVLARHYPARVGEEYYFVNHGGQIIAVEVLRMHSIVNDAQEPTDLFLVELLDPVPESAGIRFYPYLNLADEFMYTGRDIIMAGRESAYGEGRISAFINFGEDPLTAGSDINSTRVYTIPYTNSSGDQDDAYGQVGDSGAPSFAMTDSGPALTGIHSSVAETPDQRITYDTFVPHYVDQLNALMAESGYHMTMANRRSTSVDLEATPEDEQVLAGDTTAYLFRLQNTGGEDANNLALRFTLIEGAKFFEATGDGWFSYVQDDAVVFRKALLGSGGESELEVVVRATGASDEITSDYRFSYDEGADIEGSFVTEVLFPDTFAAWAAGLDDATADGDSDRDGFANLFEYAFGGDPREDSANAHNGEPLLPQVRLTQEGGQTFLEFSFHHRTDAAARQLHYEVQVSTELTENWISENTPGVPLSQTTQSVTTPSPALEGFEHVSKRVIVPEGYDGKLFMRVAVTLSEEAP